MLRALHLLFLVVWVCTAGAQGTVRGKITDNKGEALIGATVKLKSAPLAGTMTDLDGNYSLSIKSEVAETLIASFIGFQPKEVVVQPKGGEVVVLNIVLGDAGIVMKEFNVEGKARRSSDTYLDRLKINSAASVDVIGRDLMGKTGDSDAAQAVRRVTGVSTVGAFVTVRGLADRYLVTTVNGGRIPTLDPFTNNLRLDLFPTGLMDNILITKTATPDQPGDWSGAYISMNTSDYPERLFVNVSTTVGYNSSVTGKQVVSSATSSTDWLGVDDGLRAIPDGVPDAVEDYPSFIDPNLYQQLGYLGLGSYLSGYGITANSPGFSSTAMSSTGTLTHLALTELGLLAPALINNSSAVQAAVDAYNSSYNLAYFSPRINAGLARLNTAWDNSRWRVGSSTATPNYNAAFTIGNQVQLFKNSEEPKQLGFLVGLRYSTETQYDGESTIGRTIERFDDAVPGGDYKRKGVQQVSQVTGGWNALGNLSFKLNKHHSFSLLAMGNAMGQNNARLLTFLDQTISSATFVSEDQFWEQRRLWVVQYGSKHYVPGIKLTLNADLSYSTGGRDVLDLTTVQYVLPTDGGPIDDVDGALTPPGRIFRYLNEQLVDARLGMELPLGDDVKKARKLKFGGAYRWNERTNDQKYYVVLDAPGPTQWQDPARFTMNALGRFPSRYAPFGTFKDNDIGVLDVTAGYVMADYALTERLRLAGGARAERTELLSDIRRFYEEGIAADDPVRGTVGDVSINGAATPEPKAAVPGTIDRWDLLPSINLIWRLRDSSDAPMNLRLGYFRSLGRPSFREFSVVQYYDYLLQAPVFGNPDLEMTLVDNADLRLERFFRNGNNVSVSGFYKYFTNHIELLQTAAGGFTWRNAARSEVLGAEVEGRVKVLPQLEWRGNLTFMRSTSYLEVVLDGQRVEYTTPMFGQAPYIVNSTLTYTFDSLRADLSVSYNVQGPKLAVTNAELDPTGIRAYEMPRNVVDITAQKRFGEHWGLTFRVRDLLNTPVRRAYEFASGYDFDFDRFRFGTEYLLTLSYTIR